MLLRVLVILFYFSKINHSLKYSYDDFLKYYLGTKALSNMSEQFSKLNKFSHSLATKRPMELAKSIGRKSDIVDGIKPTFTLGKHELSGKMHQSSSSDDSSTGGSNENIELIPIQTERPLDFHHDKMLMEAYTPTIGIIMGVQNNEVDEVGREAEGPSNAVDGSLGVNGLNYQVTFLQIFIEFVLMGV